jgi:Baseplate J-like protein
MVNIRATDRMFGNQKVEHLPISLQGAYDELRALAKSNFPAWTDDSLADVGNQILWLTAVLDKLLIDHINGIVKNCYIDTVINRSDLQRLLTLIGYQLGSASAAAVKVTFTLEDGHPQFTIPAGTKVGTAETPESDQVVFETSEDNLVQVSDDTIDVVCIHGETVTEEITGSSDGSADQGFNLIRKPVVYHSETVEVYSGGSWNAWTRVADFVDSVSDDQHYRVEVDSSGIYRIVFGDGVNGAITTTGANNIRVSYRVGGGAAGNISASAIVELISNIDYIESVSNESAASGGTEQESIAHARKFGPASLRILERAVTENDFITLSERFNSSEHGGIAKAAAVPVGIGIQMRIVPTSGGMPSVGLKDELLEYLNDRKMLCSSVDILDPVYKDVDITADVYILDGYAVDVVVNYITAVLTSFLSPTYQDENGLYPHEFGRDAYLSDLYQHIERIPGVDHSDISVPASNVTVESHEIAKLGTLNITTYQGGTTKSYLDIGG